MKKVAVLTCLILILFSSSTWAAEWSFDFLAGAPYNFSTPLRISQEGQEDIKIKAANYESKPFTDPIYYTWRVGRWTGKQAWELGLIHQKLYLKNEAEDKGIQNFEISHGYNLVTVNRAWKKKRFIYRLGAGIILAHPNTTINGETLFEEGGLLNTGYYLAGPTVETGVEKEFPLSESLAITAEGKFTASYGKVPVAEGTAEVPNAALHGLLGLDYKF